jgi:type II secretory pathway predicted ATPase ExeA
MYETYFDLNERPFATVPRIDHYFPAAAVEAARATLVRCVERSEGVGVVLGRSGTGKTLLCQVLAVHFGRESQVALLTSGRLGSRRALLQAVLYELAQPYRGMDEGELRLALTDYLTLSDECERGAVLLVDEAHDLPLRLLDELRMLTNLVRSGAPAVRIVLAGSCALEERLASPRLDSFNQRITARCYLEPLNGPETQEYIHAWMGSVHGQGPRIFPPEVCQSVYRATEGVPRLINQLCDHALLLACQAGRANLDPDRVNEAWADLQQLPSPASAPSREVQGGVVEFGRLDDDDDQRPPRDEGDNPSATPKLRISPATNDAPMFEPHQDDGRMLIQVHPHAQPKAAEQRNPRPAEPCRTRAGLSIVDPGNPFGGEFAEEEVISERYGAPRKTKCDAAPEQPIDAAARSADSQTIVARPAAVDVARSPDYASPPTTGSSAVADACGLEIGGGEGPRPAEPGSGPAEPDDSDMVVVEEGYEDVCPWPVRSVMPVRRQEYSQLFAKLRRG